MAIHVLDVIAVVAAFWFLAFVVWFRLASNRPALASSRPALASCIPAPERGFPVVRVISIAPIFDWIARAIHCTTTIQKEAKQQHQHCHDALPFYSGYYPELLSRGL